MNTRLWMSKRIYNKQVRDLQTQVTFLWFAVVVLITWSSWLQFFGEIH